MTIRMLGTAATLVLVAGFGVAGALAQNVGREIVANCANCHGTNGRSVGAVPSLAGRPQVEIVMLVKDFRDGKRPSTIMQQLAKGYSDAQIEAAAAYLAAQKPN